MAGKATITSGLHLRTSEVLRCLRPYLRAQSQGYDTIDRQEEREAWKEEALDDLPRKDERESHRQSDEHWNRFKGDVRETYERRGGAHNYGLS